MRKMLFRMVFALVVLLVAALFLLVLFVNRLAKQGIETYVPKITQVDVDLQSVSVSLLSGKGKVNGFVIGNPPGYKTPSAITVNSATLDLKPTTLFSEVLYMESLHLQNPEITVEGNLKGNNLQKILENIETYTENEKKSRPGEEETEQKVRIDDLVITGGKLNLSLTMLGSRKLTVPLPNIHLTDLGKDTGGLTTAELTQKILTAIVESATRSITSAVTGLGQGVTDTARDLGQDAIQGAQKTVKGVVGDLFNKNKN